MNPAIIMDLFANMGQKETQQAAKDLNETVKNMTDFAKDGGMASLKDIIGGLVQIQSGPIMTTMQVLLGYLQAGTSEAMMAQLEQMLILLDQTSTKAVLDTVFKLVSTNMDAFTWGLTELNKTIDRIEDFFGVGEPEERRTVTTIDAYGADTDIGQWWNRIWH
jgi:hypothetical protein